MRRFAAVFGGPPMGEALSKRSLEVPPISKSRTTRKGDTVGQEFSWAAAPETLEKTSQGSQICHVRRLMLVKS